MKKGNLKELKDTEVIQQLKDARKELREQRFQFAVAKSLENPRKIRNLRKKIARLLTIQNERKSLNQQ
ncbi:MAG: 50S ribosomal protein L29 [Leptospiraceae bacterium]|nr:50S ribosomal protein L29 [Leptospiraceae bacterium]MCP5496647.1 50S ribosomal protein L29 [Leptospiraceae bacterium]